LGPFGLLGSADQDNEKDRAKDNTRVGDVENWPPPDLDEINHLSAQQSISTQHSVKQVPDCAAEQQPQGELHRDGSYTPARIQNCSDDEYRHHHEKARSAWK